MDTPDNIDFKKRLHIIIFGHETPAGKWFDIILLIAIICSIVVLMLETVSSIQSAHGLLLRRIEWFFTFVFTLEYIARIYCSTQKSKYVFSFFGFIDFISIIPTYLSFFYDGSRYLSVFRSVRLLRVFRVLKLARFLGEAEQLTQALKDSRYKISVFLGVVFSFAVIFGTLMYIVEGPEAGFTSIPVGVYWAVITLTTVGYGDIVPVTPLGQFISAFVMTLGYGIIAVPTGIVSAQLTHSAIQGSVKEQIEKSKKSQD